MNQIEEWSEWLRIINDDVNKLCAGREIYKEIRRMYVRNPEIQKPSQFYFWIRGLFVTWSVASVGRLVDDGRETKSFVRLLRSIRKNSHLLTRQHLVFLYAQDPSEENATGVAKRKFDELVGIAETSLPKEQVEFDIQELLKVAKPIVDLRNERVAHLDPNPSEQLPNYSQLDAAIKALVCLLQTYSLLITGTSTDVYVPLSNDWQAISRVPWIVEGK